MFDASVVDALMLNCESTTALLHRYIVEILLKA